MIRHLNKITATPDDMPSDDETLDISFSQKIPVSSYDVALRRRAFNTTSARDSRRGRSLAEESTVEGPTKDE